MGVKRRALLKEYGIGRSHVRDGTTCSCHDDDSAKIKLPEGSRWMSNERSVEKGREICANHGDPLSLQLCISRKSMRQIDFAATLLCKVVHMLHSCL